MAEVTREEYQAVVNAEAEAMVLRYLNSLGVLQYCAVNGKCEGSCPSGYTCTKLHNNNCICVKNK